MKSLLLSCLMICAAFAASGCYTVYCDSSQAVSVDSTPTGAFVWDATGKRLLGKTPLTLDVATGDWRLSRLYLTQKGYHSTEVRIVNREAGRGYIIMDGLLVLPVIFDSIAMDLNNFCGKFYGSAFHVALIPEDVPMPEVPEPPQTVVVPVRDTRDHFWWDHHVPGLEKPPRHDKPRKDAPRKDGGDKPPKK